MSAVASTNPDKLQHGRQQLPGKGSEIKGNQHYWPEFQDNLFNTSTSWSEPPTAESLESEELWRGRAALAGLGPVRSGAGATWDGQWHPLEDWSTDPSSEGPESGNVSLEREENDEDEVVVERGLLDGVRFRVVVPTHPWLLPVRDWTGFNRLLLLNMMSEFLERIFPPLAPMSLDPLFALRDNMIRRLGRDQLP